MDREVSGHPNTQEEETKRNLVGLKTSLGKGMQLQ
jgi:hypothetical protein